MRASLARSSAAARRRRPNLGLAYLLPGNSVLYMSNMFKGGHSGHSPMSDNERLENFMEHLRVLNVEHVPLHAAGRAGRQACHVVLILVPFCFGEKFACAQQISVC